MRSRQKQFEPPITLRSSVRRVTARSTSALRCERSENESIKSQRRGTSRRVRDRCGIQEGPAGPPSTRRRFNKERIREGVGARRQEARYVTAGHVAEVEARFSAGPDLCGAEPQNAFQMPAGERRRSCVGATYSHGEEEEEDSLHMWRKMETVTLKRFRFLPSVLLPRRESPTFIYSAPRRVGSPTSPHQSRPFIFLMLLLYRHPVGRFVITGDK